MEVNDETAGITRRLSVLTIGWAILSVQDINAAIASVGAGSDNSGPERNGSWIQSDNQWRQLGGTALPNVE